MACRLVGAKPLSETMLLGTNFSEILIEILTFSFKKMRLKVSSANWSPFCLGLNVLSVSELLVSAPEQLVKALGQLANAPKQFVSLPENLWLSRNSYKSSVAPISLTEEFGDTDYLHTMTTTP